MVLQLLVELWSCGAENEHKYGSGEVWGKQCSIDPANPSFLPQPRLFDEPLSSLQPHRFSACWFIKAD
uniref:ARAD1D26400p n=1 Tax=Blastobotrys adeninivorans TaxID=409370 RepID=A0A060TBA5_BLAAD